MRLFCFVVSIVSIMCLIPESSLAANVTSDNGDSNPYGHILKFVDAFQAEISIAQEVYDGCFLINPAGSSSISGSANSSVLGGANCDIYESSHSVVGGGSNNNLTCSNYTAIVGGFNNDISGSSIGSFIGGV